MFGSIVAGVISDPLGEVRVVFTSLPGQVVKKVVDYCPVGTATEAM